MTILTSDNMYFMTKSITRDNEEQYIARGAIYQKA